MMLKLLVIQRIKNISDAAMAFEVTDRASVQLFLGLPSGAKISHQTIWDYRQILDETGVVEEVVWRHLVELKETSLLSSEQTNPLILDSLTRRKRTNESRKSPASRRKISGPARRTSTSAFIRTSRPRGRRKGIRFSSDIKSIFWLNLTVTS